MTYCSVCFAQVELGALRCRTCNAPFQGPDAVPQLGEFGAVVDLGCERAGIELGEEIVQCPTQKTRR